MLIPISTRHSPFPNPSSPLGPCNLKRMHMQAFFITSVHELMHVLNDVKITIAGAIIAITHISTTEWCAEEDVSDVLNLIAERDEILATSTGSDVMAQTQQHFCEGGTCTPNVVWIDFWEDLQNTDLIASCSHITPTHDGQHLPLMSVLIRWQQKKRC